MGTNYYLRYNQSPHCDRAQELHIGKSSGGWRFSFRAYVGEWANETPDKLPIANIEDWRRVIDRDDCQIFDEYGSSHPKEYFWGLVDAKKNLKSHAQHVLQNAAKYPYHVKDNWEDEWGNSFTNNEFS